MNFCACSRVTSQPIVQAIQTSFQMQMIEGFESSSRKDYATRDSRKAHIDVADGDTTHDCSL
jgi:hypothetical protein